MELIEDNPAARWLPSRHRFALARLVAHVILSRSGAKAKDLELRKSRSFAVSAAQDDEIDHLLLPVDRDQSALETFAISIWMLAATTAYVTSLLPLPLATAILVAIPIAAFVLQVPICFGASSFILMLMAFCAAAYFATVSGPVHYVAWLSLTIFIANGVAWAIDRACGI